MLVIDKDNLKYFNCKSVRVSEVLDRYTEVRIDLPQVDVVRLLRRGAITRSQLLRSWVQITPDLVESMNINMMTRNELIAITANPIISRLALKYDLFSDTLPATYFDRCYDNVTMPEVLRYGIRLEDVLNNPTVSVDVKRVMIDNAFTEGRFPITTIEELKQFGIIDASQSLLRHLEKIAYPHPLMSDELVEMGHRDDWAYLTGRLVMLACSRYSDRQTTRLLSTAVSHHNSKEFFASLRSIDTLEATRKLYDTFPHNPHVITYIASKGVFDHGLLSELMDAIVMYGDLVDMIALYENDDLTEAMRAIVYPEISLGLDLPSMRRQLFDKLVVRGNHDLMREFCATYKDDPAMLYFLQSPQAYKKSALYCIEHVDNDIVDISTVVDKCVGSDFTESEQDLIMSCILRDPNNDTVIKFLLMSGIDMYYKDLLMHKLQG